MKAFYHLRSILRNIVIILTFLSPFLVSCSTTGKSIYRPKKIETKKQIVYNSTDKSDKKKKENKITILPFKIEKTEQIENENIFTDSLAYRRGNYPSVSSTIPYVSFETFKEADVTFELFDVKKNLVGKKIYPKLKKNKYMIDISSSNIKDGFYYYVLKHSGIRTKRGKIILMK